MPVPTSYSETELAQFMKDTLAETADVVNWTTVIGKYQEAVNETLIAYGVDSIAQATDIPKLRAIARREIWRAIADATAGNYRFGSDREQYYRDQVYAHASAQFTKASNDAAKFVTDDDSTRVSVYRIEDRNDPYVFVEDSELLGVD